ncbi:protein kinase [Trypanosoma theileri]|uniref:non-specific serine/threonine protein kinase n=1 Tax=Trypanosoma theileri TaxID=67003 RepID=A0A1X0P527_9TRYP|nr:protein kinase [Trypanosoma theileri]ORC91540.1 protein kinase [Trypanosoma theileri]
MASMDIPPSSQQVASNGTERHFENIVGAPGSTNCKYEKVRILGCGTFGEAWLVRRVSDGQLLVAKQMELSSMSDKDKKYLAGEIQCLASCDHFAIVKYIEDFNEGDHMLIIMEFADAGDLNAQIKQRERDGMHYFEEHEVGYTFAQIALALEHIHRRRMLHRDVKGANVMLMTNGIVKLGDFGFSHKYEVTVSEEVAQTFCGTPYYLSPELWRCQRYSKKADVWALGILLYEMMALRRPFVGKGMRPLMESVLSGRVSVPLPERYSPELRGVCMELLRPDPNMRPSLEQLCKMPHMIRLLKDFRYSVSASPHITDELKEQIFNNVDEVLDDNSIPASVGKVGEICESVYHEGEVRKESDNEWKKRFLVLRNGQLVISRRKGDREAKPLSLDAVASVVPVPVHTSKVDAVFAINLRDQRPLWFQAPSRKEADEWIHKIQQSMGVA